MNYWTNPYLTVSLITFKKKKKEKIVRFIENKEETISYNFNLRTFNQRININNAVLIVNNNLIRQLNVNNNNFINSFSSLIKNKDVSCILVSFFLFSMEFREKNNIDSWRIIERMARIPRVVSIVPIIISITWRAPAASVELLKCTTL